MCKCIEDLQKKTPGVELRQTYHTDSVLVGVARWVKKRHTDYFVWSRRKYYTVPWKFCPLCGEPWEAS